MDYLYFRYFKLMFLDFAMNFDCTTLIFRMESDFFIEMPKDP